MPEFFFASLQASAGALAAITVFGAISWLIRPRGKR